MVQANPDMTLAFTTYSDLTKGMVPVLKAQDRLGRVKVYEGGATKWSVDAIRAGEIHLTTALYLSTNAGRALRALDEARRGEAVPRVIHNDGVPIKNGRLVDVIDRSSISAYLAEID